MQITDVRLRKVNSENRMKAVASRVLQLVQF